MKVEDIKQKYPKSYNKLIEFSRKYLQEFQRMYIEEINSNGDKTEEVVIPEVTDKMAENMASGIINFNVRNLYDFFSENDIEINIDFMTIDSIQGRKQYMYKIYTEPVIVQSYFGRLNTEIHAFERAFSVLEEQL